MSSSCLIKALERWREGLPLECVLDPSHVQCLLKSREGFQREVPCVLRPKTVEQVQYVLRIAHEMGQAVYPISRGKNLGLGSALPVREGCAVLDLSALDRIRELSSEQMYAVIEAGVTQGQLYDEIQERALALMLNVTGAARDTSIVGNALDRGVGYFQHRVHELAGLEVVLANGELLRTGFSDRPKARCSSIYQEGLGPDLGALFSQSNFGVVTAAGFKLQPKPDRQAVVLLSSRKGVELKGFLDACIGLRRQGVLQHVLHVANGERSRITLEPLLFDQWKADFPFMDDVHLLKDVRAWLDKQPTSAWNAVCGLTGSSEVVRGAVKSLRKRMRQVAVVRVFSPRSLHRLDYTLRKGTCFSRVAQKHRFLRAVKPLLGLGFGIPSDAPQRALDWHVGDRPEEGVLYTLPLYPANTADTLPALLELEALGEACGFVVSATLNILDAHVMEGVVSIAFDRTDADETVRAQDCIREMERLSIEQGFPPYRTGIDRMDLLHSEDAVRSGLLRQLKEVFDPKGVISPGRYELPYE